MIPQKSAELDMREAAARRRIGLMDDECVPILGFAPKEPRVTVRAAVQFSSISQCGLASVDWKLKGLCAVRLA